MERSGASASAPMGRKMRSNSAARGISTGSMQRAQGTWKLPAKRPFQADVGDDLLRPAVLMNHFGLAGGGQIADLLGFLAEIDRAGLKLQVEFDRLALEIYDFEFHGMSLKHFEAAGE